MFFMDKRLEEKIQGTPAYYAKRKKDIEANEISLINQQLQRLIHHTPYTFVKEHDDLHQALQKANRSVAQSTILRLMYRNNFENIEVAIATADFLLKALPHLPEVTQQKINASLRGILSELRRIEPIQTRHLNINP